MTPLLVLLGWTLSREVGLPYLEQDMSASRAARHLGNRLARFVDRLDRLDRRRLLFGHAWPEWTADGQDGGRVKKKIVRSGVGFGSGSGQLFFPFATAGPESPARYPSTYDWAS
jgi:hypothetical protein